MKEIIKNSLVLCAITLISGLLLGVVYEVTKEPRAKQQEKAKQEAYFKVFKKADSFENVKFDAKEMKKYLKKGGYGSNVAFINEVVSAKDSSGNDLGYVVTVTDKEGYGGEIKLTIGITNDGIVNGISFLTLAETAGVGMKVDEPGFKKQFIDKEAQIFDYTNNSAGSSNHIDAIGGATVTTNAVVNGVNAGVLAYEFISDVENSEVNENEEVNEEVNVEEESKEGGEADE